MTHDPFTVLGLEPRFDVDLAAAEVRHRELSRALHPDRYQGKPAAERRMALERAIEVNAAWRALRDPVTRAEALLAAGGVELDERAEPKASPALLMEMMELQEELAEVRGKRDAVGLRRLGDTLRTRERELCARLAPAFAAARGDAARLRALLPAVGELRYLRRFFEAYAAAEEELAA
ncbi:MAG: Fe-S protein assembly co-chaperone HscB [Myxococcales bacterium]|nr:Fe-S protein assembly co-chaperone HscB [Myxococcales bacterium]